MKKLIIIFFLVNGAIVFGQNKNDLQTLQAIEDTLTPYSKQMIFAADASGRFYADSAFIRNFVKALRVPYSFNYPFDSLKTVSKLYAPDSSFRIFTWQIEMDESYFRQYGAIQMNTKDGSLKFFPLYDGSDYSAIPTDSVRSTRNWIGALYYQIVMKEFNGKKYYTLIGLDDNDFVTTRKWIEVLTFNDKGEPVFGGQYFDYPPDATKPQQPAYRFCLEFKKDAKARMNYDPDLDMIIFDHLTSETNEQDKKYTFIPDGDYEAFKWKNGKWTHVEEAFDIHNPNNNKVPMPSPILDENGKPKDPQ